MCRATTSMATPQSARPWATAAATALWLRGLHGVAGRLSAASSRSIRIRVPLPWLRLTITQSGSSFTASDRLAAVARPRTARRPGGTPRPAAGRSLRSVPAPAVRTAGGCIGRSAGSSRWMPARSHSPRLAACRPPVEPTARNLVRNPCPAKLAQQEVEPHAMAADHDQVGRLELAARAAARSTGAPASTISSWRPMVTKPSARLKVVTEPGALAHRVGGQLAVDGPPPGRPAGTRSARSRELTLTASRAATVPAHGLGRARRAGGSPGRRTRET